MSYHKKITDLIGETPLLKLENPDSNQYADVFIKLEYFNVGGSVKDRIALNLIETAEKSGILKTGKTIVEATSGNTGIGLAMVAAAKNYPLIVILPDAVSNERKQLIRAYGGTVLETPAIGGIKASFDKLEALLAENSDFLSLRQFENEANPAIHYQTTGPEIVADLGQLPDAFVAGVGTGGTLTGVGKYLREQSKDIQIFAVEPKDSAVLSGGIAGPHKIQGIGAGLIPPILNQTVYDSVIQVSNEQAIDQARSIAKNTGVLLGFSSGAAIYAAYEAAKQLGSGKKVVAIAPDNGERYLSTDLFE
ncbi:MULTISPECIES: cysteine synthase A [unclassified Enterococcus]|uniref:cysteine synthase A n=1 Tax=unclassified Enterococcus TaxID=2608891 RepID=UPI00155753C0|nr:MULTISPECIES: cysteine synthase A [unclassified Enterococcus]MBS7576583.1 cysteine synthase A [Enterococcus sp. MMGLQ5-2]MBS7583930.1 cysteine synthase A [Enterococcus sp. MMGLQ5-1]NPD11791.1 cysteine synthase A [Enterococcus sp. MMGLQ5-1]NPD36420.1 cysteine synthase A [Enterococcus sp. MMGLQ5-2]